MKREQMQVGSRNVTVITADAVVVGSGAAGWNGALQLARQGVDVCLVTEGRNAGTSRNTGSDKQTYYKLSLSGDQGDSPFAMAEDLFQGGSVDGDLAYAEAANSAACFLQLAALGVAFPTNRLGEYVGYRTDHDIRGRATSAGPLTSKDMTEHLEQAVIRAGVPVLEPYLVVDVIRHEGRAVGLIALDCTASGENGFVLFRCGAILYATGGPAGIYGNTVYPAGHAGATGVAFRAGVTGKNLTEWQFGLASTAPRWNVSGTYMQVLPMLYSVDDAGVRREFLAPYYGDAYRALNMLFRKGYEWPFDSRKAVDGSSVVDLLVYRETVEYGRKVYLDYRNNPFGLSELDVSRLDDQAGGYLTDAGAAFGTPIQRLRHMNEPAYQLYLAKGVDLEKEPLEIALCAQHNNGGLDVDCWWQTNLPGFYAAGEVAGTHGVYRPGGSALNAGQVGSLRAALHIAAHPNPVIGEDDFSHAAGELLTYHRKLSDSVLGKENTAKPMLFHVRNRMDQVAGALRKPAEMQAVMEELLVLKADLANKVSVADRTQLISFYRLRDTLETQECYLTAMLDFAKTVGATRGSALYLDVTVPGGERMLYPFAGYDGRVDGMVQEVRRTESGLRVAWREVRPLPEGGGFFENVWRGYRTNRNIY